MIPTLDLLRLLAAVTAHSLTRTRDRVGDRGERDGGYTTEAIIVTALLVALAIAAVAIITSKVLGKANSISTD